MRRMVCVLLLAAILGPPLAIALYEAQNCQLTSVCSMHDSAESCALACALRQRQEPPQETSCHASKTSSPNCAMSAACHPARQFIFPLLFEAATLPSGATVFPPFSATKLSVSLRSAPSRSSEPMELPPRPVTSVRS